MAQKLKKLITTEELNSLQTKVKASNQIQLQIGGIEAHKQDMLIELKKQTQELQEIQKELENKYGSVNIDLQTGEIQKNVTADNKKN